MCACARAWVCACVCARERALARVLDEWDGGWGGRGQGRLPHTRVPHLDRLVAPREHDDVLPGGQGEGTRLGANQKCSQPPGNVLLGGRDVQNDVPHQDEYIIYDI